MDGNNQIHEKELLRLLENDETADQAIATYFQIDETMPFKITYELKPEIEVIADAQLEGRKIKVPKAIKKMFVRLANGRARRKRRNRYKKIIEEHPERTRIVSEGDSWFQYPGIKDIIDHLFNYFAIFSVGAAGDELSKMFRKNEYLPALKEEGAEILLLSGGGNDLMGGHFGDYLKEYAAGREPRDSLNNEFFAKIDDMMNIYQTLFAFIKRKRPDTKILFHGYDYVIPRSEKKGKWLGRPMEKKGITKDKDKKALMRFIIDYLNERLKSLSDQHGNAVFVDVRDTVREDYWHDEIHPNDDGFQQVALKFMNRINTISS
ncbi:MAG: SGNH/GDSL hydrolase family protein [Candidatus Aminicenantes bacterium]|nr:SGNH/GDSL hydrolase family protein [Candidatus Aminicenantes bacterium]